ncbi:MULTISPECIES: hypothetical protein [unclassified Aliiroseovarius]|nr:MULTISPECIES: hypothetical protein [unclassified Aliiroseovarius]
MLIRNLHHRPIHVLRTRHQVTKEIAHAAPRTNVTGTILHTISSAAYR